MELSWEKPFNVLFSQGCFFRRIIGNKYQWTQKIPSGVIITPLGIYVTFVIFYFPRANKFRIRNTIYQNGKDLKS